METLTTKEFNEVLKRLPPGSFRTIPVGTLFPVKAKHRARFRDGLFFLLCDLEGKGIISTLVDEDYALSMKADTPLKLEFREIRPYGENEYALFSIIEDLAK